MIVERGRSWDGSDFFFSFRVELLIFVEWMWRCWSQTGSLTFLLGGDTVEW